MSFVQSLSVAFALAVCAAPVLLLRRSDRRGGSDQPVPPAIIRNAWIAYSLRVSVVVPLFASGAAGDLWPALVGAVGFGAGVCLLGAARRRANVVDSEARRPEAPASLQAFLAEDSGGVRLAAASLTAVALLGLAAAEAAALVVVVKPLTGEGSGAPLFVALVAVAGLYAAWAGTDRVRYVSQAQLGAIHLGVFGSAAFLLYLSASDLHPLPPHGAFALMVLTTASVAILVYRQTKYMETPALVGPDETSRWRRAVARQVRLLQRLANVAISVFAVLVVVIAGMEFYALGVPETLRTGVAALGVAPRIPAVGLAGIAILALTYPLVDPVSWRSAGDLAASVRAAGGATAARAHRPIRTVAGETAAIWLLVAALGAIAALATDLPRDSTEMPDLIRQLVVFDNAITDSALTLLLVGGFAMAASTMGMAVSTAVRIVACEILPVAQSAWSPLRNPLPSGERSTPGTLPGGRGEGVERSPEGSHLLTLPSPHRGEGSPREPSGQRVLIVVPAVIVGTASMWLVSGVPSAGLADARFFAVALSFAGLQVALLPLLLARLLGVRLSPGAALTMLGGGAMAPLCCIAVYVGTASALWLWCAIPAGLASGLLLLAAAASRGNSARHPVDDRGSTDHGHDRP